MSDNEKKSPAKELEEQLTYRTPDIAQKDPAEFEKAFDFCEPYKAFLTEIKTEREFAAKAAGMLREAGYTPFDETKAYKPGDKVYYENRSKAVIATTFGTKPLSEGIRLNAAHIDAPRLDLKANPLFERKGLAYFKPHYYGGLRKYQWTTIPLSLHGVIYKKDGEKITVRIGEDPADPVFYISDLLPHLAAHQNARRLSDGIRGEELNIIVGSLPYPDEDVKEPVKLKVLQLLHEKYGITEADFYRAELEVTAAGPARDVGFDRSLIAAVGHDDRVCAYPALRAEIATVSPTYTTVPVLTDKEEIGSVGTTGLNSDYVLHYIEALADNAGVRVRQVLTHSLSLSSDVSAAYDPTFADVFEPNNSCYLGKGCVLSKYTGARGKSGSNDASAETMYKVIDIMNSNHVYWQAGEIGKVDEGGGGTVAQYIAHMDIDVVDLGVPVLAMHAPVEVVSKLDVYEAYKAFRAFYR